VRSTSRYDCTILDHIIHNPRVNGGGISGRRGKRWTELAAESVRKRHALEPAT